MKKYPPYFDRVGTFLQLKDYCNFRPVVNKSSNCFFLPLIFRKTPAMSPIINESDRGTPPRRSNKGKPLATPQSGGKRSVRPPERAAASPARPTPASRSSPMWSSRCGSANGCWMLAAAAPRDSVCSLKTRWSAPTPSTTWYGMACLEDRRGQRMASQEPRTPEEELRVRIAQPSVRIIC